MTDAAEILSPSPTGVPARLRIAGVGARAYAFTVDFNIRIAIAFAWYSTGAVLHSSVNAAEVSLRRPREPDLWWTPSPRNEAVPPFARDRGTARHPGR